MKGIYLASFKAKHEDYDIVYQDINGKRDIAGDMLKVDLEPYDFIIATPSCNYYSRANYRRETSEYSQATKHLLPDILKKLSLQEKPYIVENVRNKRLMSDFYDLAPFVYEHGRHTYWTNIQFNPFSIIQVADFIPTRKKIGHKQFIDEVTGKIYKSNCTKRTSSNSEGGENVHNVIEYWLQCLIEKEKPNE